MASRCTPTMTFGMRWHGVAWRGAVIKIAQNKHCLASPHLAHANSGFPRGFPIASPPLPPISGKSHKPPTLIHPPRPWHNLLSLAATQSSWGYPPALPNSRSPRYHTFHLRALFACFSLSPHSSSPGSSTSTAPALPSRPEVLLFRNFTSQIPTSHPASPSERPAL